MNHDELVAYSRETLRLAEENHVLAESNWANIVPWRYHRWWRTQRQVRANLREIRRRRAVVAAEL